MASLAFAGQGSPAPSKRVLLAFALLGLFNNISESELRASPVFCVVHGEEEGGGRWP